mmetsp:Transcript_10923/g.27497  ORF Transcript_10923/g.27497 Transcript_10923/m.27497 type:complete len:367 (-) Transcript_10923:694-1794(-)
MRLASLMLEYSWSLLSLGFLPSNRAPPLQVRLQAHPRRRARARPPHRPHHRARPPDPAAPARPPHALAQHRRVLPLPPAPPAHRLVPRDVVQLPRRDLRAQVHVHARVGARVDVPAKKPHPRDPCVRRRHTVPAGGPGGPLRGPLQAVAGAHGLRRRLQVQDPGRHGPPRQGRRVRHVLQAQHVWAAWQARGRVQLDRAAAHEGLARPQPRPEGKHRPHCHPRGPRRLPPHPLRRKHTHLLGPGPLGRQALPGRLLHAEARGNLRAARRRRPHHPLRRLQLRALLLRLRAHQQRRNKPRPRRHQRPVQNPPGVPPQAQPPHALRALARGRRALVHQPHPGLHRHARLHLLRHRPPHRRHGGARGAG